jgi:hypothetical protein
VAVTCSSSSSQHAEGLDDTTAMRSLTADS